MELKMKKRMAVTILITALFSTLSLANVVSLRGNQEVGAENKVPTLKPVPKNQTRFALNYVNQPPMIPHAVDGYQMNQSNNACLDCHGVENYRKTGAVRVSPTHYLDRDNKLLADVAPRRYFCLQCHVPQAQAEPLVENNFKPAQTK